MKIDSTVQLSLEPKALVATLRRIWERLAIVINGGISFGDGVTVDNIDGVWVNIVTPVPIVTPLVVTHNLGREPVGYLVVAKSAAVDLYLSASDDITITFMATAGGVAVRVFIF